MSTTTTRIEELIAEGQQLSLDTPEEIGHAFKVLMEVNTILSTPGSMMASLKESDVQAPAFPMECKIFPLKGKKIPLTVYVSGLVSPDLRDDAADVVIAEYCANHGILPTEVTKG